MRAVAARRRAAAGGRQLVWLRRHQRPRDSGRAAAGRRVAARTPVERPRHLLTLSARSAEALAELAGRYADFAARPSPTGSLADLAFTANTGRMHFTHRAAVVGGVARRNCAQTTAGVLADPTPDAPACIAAWSSTTGRRASPSCSPARGPSTPAWDARCTRRSRRSARRIDRCAEMLRPLLDRPLLALLDPQAGSLLDQTGYTQPVMFALEYALATLWRSWGVEPAAVMGHSVGEFAAACVAGVFSLEDGLRLIAERARLMQSLPPGGLMAAVFASPSRSPRPERLRPTEVAIAAFNGPQSVVISGDEAAVRELLARLRAAGHQVQAAGHLARLPLAPDGSDPGRRCGGCSGSLPSLPPQIDVDLQSDGPSGRRADVCRSRLLESATRARRSGSPRACRRWPTAAAMSSWKSAPAPR